MTDQTIGHFEILGEIGRGAMGVVYKARDTRLDRIVAVKKLNPEYADRLGREARAVASLNHPNISTIHEVGDGYLVMEYVEGKPIAGPLTVGEARRIGLQIAEALAAAHAQGIVHRDLKPTNVLITPAGRVKVLDFGLAKRFQTLDAESGNTATIATREGTIVGTVSYMSPEQAQGKPVDARSDQFAFGAVLYELVTGERAFTGDSAISTLAAILKEEPKPAGRLTGELAGVIARCLKKDPAQRYTATEDLVAALTVAPIKAAPRWWMAAAAVLAFAAAGLAYWKWPRAAPTLPTPVRITSDFGATVNPSVSADGKLMVYSSDRSGEGNFDLWIQQMPKGEPIRLTNSPGDEAGEISPDGTTVVYESRQAGNIYIKPVLGAAQPRLLVERAHSPHFSPDGKTILYLKRINMEDNGELHTISPDGTGDKRILERRVWNPSWLPDGRRVLYPGRGRTFSISLDGGALDEVGKVPVDFNARAFRTAQGDYLFTSGQGGEVMATPIDAVGHIAGERVVLAKTESNTRPGAYAAGTYFYTAGTAVSQIWNLPMNHSASRPSGTASMMTRSIEPSMYPTLAATAPWMTYHRAGRGIVKRNLETGAETVLGPGVVSVISPDGKNVATNRRDTLELILDGVKKEFPGTFTMRAWSPDNRYVVGQTSTSEGLNRLMRVDSATGEVADLVSRPNAALYTPQISPDGKWLVAQCRDTALKESIVAAPFRPTGKVAEDEWIVVASGEGEYNKPRWSPDGGAVYFTSTREGKQAIWVVRVGRARPTPSGSPTLVYTFPRSAMTLAQIDMAVGRDRIVFPQLEIKSNIWMLKWP